MIDYRLASKIHFDELDRYLAAYLAREAPNPRSTARQKLARLTVLHCHEISADVYDEIARRKSEGMMGFHPTRNQAREKLATLPTPRFQDLCGDVHFELVRRYPEFGLKEVRRISLPEQSNSIAERQPSGRASPSPSWASEDNYVAGMSPPTRLRTTTTPV
ncbi:hypothetical protein BD779DRAFT_1472000 [Infundibulicybe gibba]|nr:hypothetical protein BD779DRAFT_1472000 [Infundibulicybe gibba]